MTRVLYANPISKASGAEFSLLALMEHLDRSIYEPILLCPNDGLLPQLCRERSIKTVFLPTIPLPGSPVLDTYRTLVSNARAIKAIIQSLGVQLVHSNTPRMAYHSGLAAHWAGVPNVTHVRDISQSPFASPLKARLLDFLSDRIVTVSQATLTAITQHASYLSAKTHVVYNGVGQPSRFDASQIQSLRTELGATDRTPLLATIGQLSPWKGQAIILRALPSILMHYPDTLLLIVGEPLVRKDDAFRLRLIEMVEQLRLSRHVLLTGFRHDIALILSAIDLLVHYPVKPDPLPRILLEASAQGTLIVASNVGGIREIVLDGVTGRLVPPEQPEALAQTIIETLRDPAQARLMRTAASQRASQMFSIEQHAAHMQAIYDDLVSRAGVN